MHSSPRLLNVEIFVNGAARTISAGLTIAELLGELRVTERHVAVELNGELAPRARHAECRLAAGDRLEVVTLVGGG